MIVSRLLVCSALAVSLSGCFLTGSSDDTTATAPVAIKKIPSQVSSVNVKGTKKFNLYVGSIHKGDLKTVTKKGKKKHTTTIKQDVVVKAGDMTYYTSGALVEREDVRTAFVAKTVSGSPALGIRLNDAARVRLTNALTSNRAGTVLASLDDSVFSQVTSDGAKLQDGVLLLPMVSLNDARDVAELIRKK